MRLFALIGILFFLNSCGSVDVYFPNNSMLQKNSNIVIIGGEDKTETKNKLESSLTSLGFIVIDADQIDKISDSNIYVIYISYDYYWDIFYYSYRKFYAKITEYNTKEVIGNVNFVGDRSVDSVIEKFVDRVRSRIK